MNSLFETPTFLSYPTLVLYQAVKSISNVLICMCIGVCVLVFSLCRMYCIARAVKGEVLGSHPKSHLLNLIWVTMFK